MSSIELVSQNQANERKRKESQKCDNSTKNTDENNTTKRKSGQATNESAVVSDSCWKREVDEGSGKEYMYHVVTHETKWCDSEEGNEETTSTPSEQEQINNPMIKNKK